MKKLFCMAVAAFALTAAIPAHAQDDWRKGLYIKGGAGWNHVEDTDVGAGLDAEFDEGYNLTGAVGYDYGDLRSEIEITYRDNDLDSVTGLADASGEVNSTAFMLNGYYDIPMGSVVTPYVGAGVGVAHVNAEDFTAGGASIADEDDTVFAYQAMAGVEMNVAPQVDLYTEYKYFGTDDVDLGGGSELENRNHTVMAGVKYSLN